MLLLHEEQCFKRHLLVVGIELSSGYVELCGSTAEAAVSSRSSSRAAPQDPRDLDHASVSSNVLSSSCTMPQHQIRRGIDAQTRTKAVILNVNEWNSRRL